MRSANHISGQAATTNSAEKEEDDDELQLYHLFSPACYEGLDTPETGFYAIYAAAFERIDEAERNAADQLVF